MKNAARLNALLNAPEGAPSHKVDLAAADNTAKIQFRNESLTIRHKQGVTLALRQIE
jgi:hypothetical protein